MNYRGPQPADLADVAALNRAYLDCVSVSAAPRADQLPAVLPDALQALTIAQAERLAGVPFLIFSLRENEGPYWDSVLCVEDTPDLFAAAGIGTRQHRLLAAALSFVWQLAKTNPYAARLVCGASAGWCRELARYSLIALLDRAARRADMLVARMPANRHFWQRLLGPGLSPVPDICRAAHICALQTILTSVDDRHYRQLQSAACRKSDKSLRVAERRRSR